jgi:hypothetical protein
MSLPRSLSPRRRGAGVQKFLHSLDSRFHGNDGKGRFTAFCGAVKRVAFVIGPSEIIVKTIDAQGAF